MKYYHLHTKTIKDKFWMENKEIVVDNNFKNRLAIKCENFDISIPSNDYKYLSNYFNEVLQVNMF